MKDLIPEARLIPVYLPEWGITVPYAQVDGGPLYIVVRMMCVELGVNVDGQVEKLSEEYPKETTDIMVEMRVPTGGGRQRMWCLRKAEAALWVATINPRKVKPPFRGHLEEIRQTMLLAADRIVFGDHTNTLIVSSTPARGGNLHLGDCPKCRTTLGGHFTPEGIKLYMIDTDKE